MTLIKLCSGAAGFFFFCEVRHFKTKTKQERASPQLFTISDGKRWLGKRALNAPTQHNPKSITYSSAPFLGTGAETTHLRLLAGKPQLRYLFLWSGTAASKAPAGNFKSLTGSDLERQLKIMFCFCCFFFVIYYKLKAHKTSVLFWTYEIYSKWSVVVYSDTRLTQSRSCVGFSREWRWEIRGKLAFLAVRGSLIYL